MPAFRAFRSGQNPPRLEFEGSWMLPGEVAVLTRADLNAANVQNTKAAIEAYVNGVWLPAVCAGRCFARLVVHSINGPNDIHWTIETSKVPFSA